MITSHVFKVARVSYSQLPSIAKPRVFPLFVLFHSHTNPFLPRDVHALSLSSTWEHKVDGKVVLRFAYAYGFRNIQSILAKSRRGKCPYHFVEVMACPSGCLNGGGQIKPKKEGPRDTRQRVEMVAGVLHKDLLPRAPQDNPLVQAMYRELLGGEPGAPAARPFFHTTYHNVPKLEESNPHMSPW